jgi:diguanylate cyclase (GGDEF)-like protein
MTTGNDCGTLWNADDELDKGNDGEIAHPGRGETAVVGPADGSHAPADEASLVGYRLRREDARAAAAALRFRWAHMGVTDDRTAFRPRYLPWGGRWDRAGVPAFVFAAVAILVLGVIWGTTLRLLAVERGVADHTATQSSREQFETYQAQVVRALREVDQTLKVVKYAYELRGGKAAFVELRDRNLLPPDRFFEVRVTDSLGTVVSSSRPLATASAVDQETLQIQRLGDTFSVGRPRRDPASGEWRLQFSRRLDSPDGQFAGVVAVAVDSAYFVSGYDSATLGEHGVLGLVGVDGIVRAMRSGDVVTASQHVDFAALVSHSQPEVGADAVSTSPWDGVRRYTNARQLYDFPLAVIVGLSADEQLAASRRDGRTYLWRASAGSVLLIMVIALLAHLSRRLASSRRRAADAQVAHAARIEYLAYHDGLTGLPNRSLFSKLLVQSIHEAHRYNRRLAVLFLDLDRFKQINDTLGHEAGDQLLQEVANRLKACLRDSDTVARLGGDEFVVLLPELDDGKYVVAVGQKILSAVARPFVLIGQEFRVTVSIGISTYPQDGLDERTLTKNADIAMYQAKEMGKNNFQFYSEKLNAHSLERLNLESGLRHALERGEFELEYQAKRDIRSGGITGLEALLRWRHPDLGTIAPMQFIPIAEDTGLIVPIGKWVFDTVCRQNAAWLALGLQPVSIAVNLTARQFSDSRLVSDLAAALSASGMPAHLLELEIAESLLMRDVAASLAILARLKELGVRIAVDDFGIGYLSLSTLKQFPLDSIKIDRSFIRDASSGVEDRALTEAIFAMGRTLSMTVVAQGVETKEQADFLRKNACDEFQGFYFDKPVPAGQIGGMLRAGVDDVDREDSPSTLA